MEPDFSTQIYYDDIEFKKYAKVLTKDYKSGKKGVAVVYALFLAFLKVSLRYADNYGIWFDVIFYLAVAGCVFFWFYHKKRLDKKLNKKLEVCFVREGTLTIYKFYKTNFTAIDCWKAKSAKVNYAIPDLVPNGYVAIHKIECPYYNINRMYEINENFYIEVGESLYSIKKKNCSDGLINFLEDLKDRIGT